MIKLTLTEEQAKVVSRACEFFCRIKIGQFNEITWELLDYGLEDYCERRDAIEQFLLAARKLIYPELLYSFGHSYGIGKFDDADMAFDVYQVLRHQLGDWREPFEFYHPLPKCERCVDE